MTEQQEKQAKEAFLRIYEGFSAEDYPITYKCFCEGFEAGLEASKEQPASICRGCGNYNDGYCNLVELPIANIHGKDDCSYFFPVAFDEKEQSR